MTTSNATQARTYSKSSLKDRIKIADFLKGVLVKDADSAYYTYTGGLTDESIAASMSKTTDAPVTASVVGGVRRELYGDLRRATSGAIAEVHAAQIKVLQDIVATHAAEMQKLIVRLGTLEMAFKNKR